MILLKEDSKRRATIIKYFISVADVSVHVVNLHCVCPSNGTCTSALSPVE